MKTIAMLAVLLYLQGAAAEDGDFSQEAVKSTAVTPSIFMLEGAGGNMTALLGPEGVLLVDDDFAPMAGKLVAKLKELGGTSPRYIVNTHFHYDHTGGNEVFGSSATILAATAVRDRLSSEQMLWHKRHLPEPRQALPGITFDTSLSLHFDQEEVRLVHLPHGHTDGDTVVFFKRSKVVSMGDLYFAGMYPIFHPEHEGSLAGLIKNIETVLSQTSAQDKFIPGHGPLSSRADLEKYYRMILASVLTVKRGMAGNHTLAEIQRTGLAKDWEPYSHGYLNTDQWIELLYKNLK